MRVRGDPGAALLRPVRRAAGRSRADRRPVRRGRSRYLRAAPGGRRRRPGRGRSVRPVRLVPLPACAAAAPYPGPPGPDDQRRADHGRAAARRADRLGGLWPSWSTAGGRFPAVQQPGRGRAAWPGTGWDGPGAPGRVVGAPAGRVAHRRCPRPRRPRRAPSATPASPAASQPPGGSMPVVMAPGVRGDPVAAQIQVLVASYFTAINDHDFQAYRHLLLGPLRRQLSAAQFAQSYGVHPRFGRHPGPHLGERAVRGGHGHLYQRAGPGQWRRHLHALAADRLPAAAAVTGSWSSRPHRATTPPSTPAAQPADRPQSGGAGPRRMLTDSTRWSAHPG